jgi:hypothetical protein
MMKRHGATMKAKIWSALLICGFLGATSGALSADSRSDILELAVRLEQQAASLARESFEHFKGWKGEISDQEQGILFKSEAFSACCRLFVSLAEERTDYWGRDHLRTNLFNAFTYLVNALDDLKREMDKGGVRPFALSDCSRLLERMEREFSRWPETDNLAYLNRKYVKAADDTVYLIEQIGIGRYVRRPFKNLESHFRFNYDMKQGKDPWKYLVEVDRRTLEKMDIGVEISLTFEGKLVLEAGNRPNRAVYLIRDGKKCPLASPVVLDRFGGWSKVFDLPVEVVAAYPEGEEIN